MILMRDMNLTYLVFKEQLDTQLNKKVKQLFSKDILILRSAVIDNPTFPKDFRLILPRKFYLLRGLCLIWDKLPESLGFEIFLLLEEEIEKLDFKKKLELKLLINLKTRYQYLYRTRRYSSHEIFGNLLHDSQKAISEVKISKVCTKVKKPQRKRGYDDKGTLRSYDIWSHKWTPSFDWSLTELQNQKEKKQKLQEKYTSLLIKLLRE